MAPKKKKPAAAKKKAPRKEMTLNLALQGGGAHGAFTWGVLDRLLEEEDIRIAAISGTSAGAMNAAVLAEGFARGGRQGAKDELARFWGEISGASKLLGPWLSSPFGPMQDALNSAPVFSFVDLMTRMFSPYEFNPLNLNPLRTVLENTIDFDRLRGCQELKVFVTATNVETGQPRVFHGQELTVDVLLASGCLPFLFQAVEIDGAPYWDGGYMGNPSIWPLYYHTECGDVMLVQINPVMRQGTPRTSMDIVNRLNEITFNSSLIAEMRAIQFVRKLIERGALDEKDYRHVNIHRVAPADELQELTASSKLNPSWEFFTFLHAQGRAEMERWLSQHKKMLGVDSTLDIEKTFLIKPRRAPRSAPKVAHA